MALALVYMLGVTAGLMALVSVAAAFSGWTKEAFVQVTLSSFAAIVLASGLITLRLFIRRTRPIAEDDE